MVTRTRTVKMSGRRLSRLSVHSSRNSSLWLFFITSARMNGEMQTSVSSPVTPLAHQWGSRWRMVCSTNVSITAVTAMQRMV